MKSEENHDEIEEDCEPVSEEEKRMLDERWAAYLRNPKSALTLDQLKAKLEERLNMRRAKS